MVQRPKQPALACLCPARPVPALLCSSPVRPADALMPRCPGNVAVCVICDAAAAAELAIPHRPCAHVSMISLAVSDFDVKGRDRGRDHRDHPVSEGFSREEVNARPVAVQQYMPYTPAGYSYRTSNLPVHHQVSRTSMTVVQAACFHFFTT